MIKQNLLDKKTFKKAENKPVSAKAVVLSGGKVLLLKQPNGRWDLPGGKIGKDEDIVEGLIREVKEETGLMVWPMKFLVSKTRRVKKNQDLLIITFLCSTVKPIKKKHIQLSKEHKKFTFVDLTEAYGLNMRNRQRKAIKAAEDYVAELAAAVS